VYPRSCQYCSLHGVCRVAESRGISPSEDAGQDESAE
jgi:hypothetical protein